LWELIGQQDRKPHKNFRNRIVGGKKSGKTFTGQKLKSGKTFLVEKNNPEKLCRLKVKSGKTLPVKN